MKMDDNVWNDRDTDDFLRYLKFEYFMLCYMMSFAMMEVIFGFMSFTELEKFGHNNSELVQKLFAMVLSIRMIHLCKTTTRYI